MMVHMYQQCGSMTLHHRDTDLYLWKMDRTENASRMRLKLARNYNYNKHTDASQQSSDVMPSKYNTADTRLLAMATATKSSAEEEEEHLVDQIQMLARDEPSVALEKDKKEKLVRRETCQLVTLVEVISGTLDITNKCIYFVSDPQDKDTIPCEYVRSFNDTEKEERRGGEGRGGEGRGGEGRGGGGEEEGRGGGNLHSIQFV